MEGMGGGGDARDSNNFRARTAASRGRAPKGVSVEPFGDSREAGKTEEEAAEEAADIAEGTAMEEAAGNTMCEAMVAEDAGETASDDGEADEDGRPPHLFGRCFFLELTASQIQHAGSQGRDGSNPIGKAISRKGGGCGKSFFPPKTFTRQVLHTTRGNLESVRSYS